MRKILLFILISVSIFSSSYRVMKVSDGDTITVLNLETSEKIKIRLYGVDSPEMNQSFGTQAKEYLTEQILNREVQLEIKNIDRYKRTVAIVYLGNININELMLSEGWAWWYEAYAKKEYKYKELQEEAQRKRLGIWRKKGNIPPWEFRKSRRKND